MYDSATPRTIESMEFSRPEYWVGSLSILRGIFLTQESNQGLLHCRQILYQLSYQGSPLKKKKKKKEKQPLKECLALTGIA